MRSAVLQGGRLLMLWDQVFTMRNVQIWAVPSFKGVGFLMLSDRVFRLRTVEKWQCPPARRSNCWCSGIAFSGCETFRYGQCLPARLTNFDVQKSCIQTAKRSGIGSAVKNEGDLLTVSNRVSSCESFKYGQCRPTWGSIFDAQESRFQAAKLSEMCNAVPQVCWFLNVQ